MRGKEFEDAIVSLMTRNEWQYFEQLVGDLRSQIKDDIVYDHLQLYSEKQTLHSIEERQGYMRGQLWMTEFLMRLLRYLLRRRMRQRRTEAFYRGMYDALDKVQRELNQTFLKWLRGGKKKKSISPVRRHDVREAEQRITR